METTVEQEIANINNMDKLIHKMNSHARQQLRNVVVKQLEGRTPEDFVMDVFEKTLNGTRDWSKSKVSFHEFLFGCLRSDISNFIKKISRRGGGHFSLLEGTNLGLYTNKEVSLANPKPFIGKWDEHQQSSIMRKRLH